MNTRSVLRSLIVAQWLILIGMLVLVVSGVYSARGLYSDGPFWLYKILTTEKLYISDPARSYAQVLLQIPVVTALKLGVVDLNVLMRIHSFGLVAVPIIFWTAALCIQFRTYIFWLLVTAFAVTYLRSNFFAAGEYSVTYGMVALCVSLMAQSRVGLVSALALVATSFGLTHAYESMSFLGILLASFALTRLASDKQITSIHKYSLIMAVCCFGYSSFVAIRSMLYEREYSLHSTINFNALIEFHVLYLIVTTALIISVLLNISAPKKNSIMAFCMAISGIYSAYCFLWDSSGISFGFFSYAYRSHGAFLFAGLILFICLAQHVQVVLRQSMFVLTDWRIGFMAGTLFAVMAIPLVCNSFGFYYWLKSFETEAESVQGLVPFDKTAIAPGLGPVAGYNWPWSNSTLSVLLRGNAEGIVTNESNFTGWETFDPRHLEKYPLKQYIKKTYFHK